MKAKLAVCVLAAALLAGCGSVVRIAYNNADYAARLAAHEWFDLHGDQAGLMRTRIEGFHEWHRREELPRYGRLFAGAADRIERGLAREDVEWAIGRARERLLALAEQAVDEATPVVATFTPANFAAMARKFAEGNERMAKDYDLALDPAKRERTRFKAIAGRFEEWTGPLTAEQEALVQAYVRAAPNAMSVMLEDRRRRQREFLQLLETYRASPELNARLRAYVAGWEAGRGPEYAQLARVREQELIRLVLDFDRTLTPKQRAHAVAKLRRYADDWFTLAAEGRKAPPAGMKTAAPQRLDAGGG